MTGPWRAHLFRAVWAWQSLRVRMHAVVLLAAATGMGLGITWWAPELKEELQAHQRTSLALQAKLQGLQQQLRQVLASAAQASNEPGAVVQSVSSTPWHLHRLALDAGLTVEQLKPQEAEGPRPAQVQLRLRGRYHQHGAFVAALANEPLAFRLLSYQLQGAASGTVVAELRLEGLVGATPLSSAQPGALRYSAAEQLDPFAAGQLEPTAQWPAALQLELARPRGVLETAPLSAFEFVGTLRRDDEWVALMRSQGQVHTLRTGEYIGPQLGRVVRIAEQGLWLRELVRAPSGQWVPQERLWRMGEKP